MIEKGLKVGDVFEDGGLFYVVDKIVGSGYISHMISKEEKQAVESKSAEPETMDEPEAHEVLETVAEPETPDGPPVKKPASQKRTYKKRGQ